jgi:hypothetical protein
MMNWQLLIAGILALIATAGHAIGGEMTNIRPLMKTDLPQNLKVGFRNVWHMVSIAALASALMLLFMGIAAPNFNVMVIARGIAVAFALWGAIWLVLTAITNAQLLIKLPQWILMFAVAIFAWWGASVVNP